MALPGECPFLSPDVSPLITELLLFLIIFGNYPNNSHNVWQNWRINSQNCAAAFLRPLAVAGWLTAGNHDVPDVWELFLQSPAVV
jgi:hypothetical protein